MSEDFPFGDNAMDDSERADLIGGEQHDEEFDDFEDFQESAIEQMVEGLNDNDDFGEEDPDTVVYQENYDGGLSAVTGAGNIGGQTCLEPTAPVPPKGTPCDTATSAAIASLAMASSIRDSGGELVKRRDATFSTAGSRVEGINRAPRFITDPNERQTSNIMTKYEYARVIGNRAREIEDSGASDVSKSARESGITNSLDVAEYELEDVSSPFHTVIYRDVQKNVYEVWPVRDLLLPSQVLCQSYNLAATKLIEKSNAENCPWNPEVSQTLIFKKFALVSHST
jgi:DNA-directed RNA polymerase subunit K/omega